MEYQPPPPPTSPESPTPQKTSMGLEPNIAAALSYLCGWLTGLIFFLVEKESNFVRFHAMQSIITFGALTVLHIGLSILGFMPYVGGWLTTLGSIFLGFAGLIVWILLLVKAFQGERFHLPVVGEMAEKYLK